uniref:Anaphase-promoting complex subunit 2 n=1 Tax=Sus scrofa TaxID=9823 RepID=A0A8D1CD80_PIG
MAITWGRPSPQPGQRPAGEGSRDLPVLCPPGGFFSEPMEQLCPGEGGPGEVGRGRVHVCSVGSTARTHLQTQAQSAGAGQRGGRDQHPAPGDPGEDGGPLSGRVRALLLARVPQVDREGGRLAGQGVPAGRPLQARVGGGRQHAAPLALPRAEVLLPHLRGSAHRGALQHHPRSAPPARGTFPAPLFFSSWQGVLWGADLGLGVLSRAGPSPGSGAWSLFWAGPLGSSGLALGITLSPRGGGGQVCGRRKREGCTRPEQAPCRSPQRPGCSLWAAAERLSTCTVCACPCACARTRPLPTDFPDSRPAIEDLKYCLERTDQRQQLLVSLKAALETRLLHPGVSTCDIITLYISAIKALRALDPSMVVLDVACEPIRRYLRTREDTVRQIVAGLTGDSDGTGDLAVELSKTDPASLETGQDSEDDSGEPEDWVPDPVDADPGKSSSRRRSSDIISLLVSIYGSKDLFINEYRSLLADRLLHQFSFSPEREIRNVELLKLRFGEAPMHFCEVMLKDMADSRRINANIREEDEKRPPEEQPPFGVYAVILSSEFWPPFKDEKLEVPEDIREALEVYCRKYEKLKAMRTLSWKHTLGLVTMDVELADRTLSVAVTPVQAVVLLYFQDQASWTLEELSKAVKMPVALLRRRMSVWLQQGVLREEPAGTFSVVEEERPQDRDSMVLIDSDDESDSGMASQADQKEEELLLFWTYIQAMLTNLESLSLERIYSMLRMFVVTGPALAEIDLQELQGFLQKKVRDQQLVYAAGVYRLPKSCG